MARTSTGPPSAPVISVRVAGKAPISLHCVSTTFVAARIALASPSSADGNAASLSASSSASLVFRYLATFFAGMRRIALWIALLALDLFAYPSASQIACRVAPPSRSFSAAAAFCCEAAKRASLFALDRALPWGLFSVTGYLRTNDAFATPGLAGATKNATGRKSRLPP